MIRRRLVAAAVAATTTTAVLVVVPGSAGADDYTVQDSGRVSVGAEGQQADDRSVVPSASGDGRLIAFESNATNLVPDDDNNVSDIFVRDVATGETHRISVTSDGREADGPSRSPVISQDGSAVAFVSTASNLDDGDTNGVQDVFVHDLETGITIRASLGADGLETTAAARNPAISGDGSRVAFDSTASTLVDGDANGTTDVFVRDLVADTTLRVSVAEAGDTDSFSFGPSISADGLTVAFTSGATNLVDGDTNEANDVFVADLDSGAIELISRNTDGAVASVGGGNGSVQAKLSADGSAVAFLSEAPDLVDGDTNGTTDVFVHDRTTGETTRVSVGDDGVEADSFSFAPTISGDGSLIAFASGATNLVPGDTNALFDIFVHNRISATTSRANVAADGSQANSFSFAPSIAGDGSIIAFYSSASNLVSGDDNFLADVFVSRLLTCNGVEVDVDLNSGESPTDGDDVILGTPGDDVIDAGDGDDIVCGGGGDDVIVGGDGDDEIDGGTGDDTIAGGAGDDLLFGGPGDDVVHGHAGDDLIDTGDGDDAASGGAGFDVLEGGDGIDALAGGDDDVIVDPDTDTPDDGTDGETEPPLVDDPPADEPVDDAPPVVEEPAADDPADEQPPVIDDPPAEEPPADEPEADQPPVGDDPPADEPDADQTVAVAQP